MVNWKELGEEASGRFPKTLNALDEGVCGMKVYIIRWFDAEPYSYNEGIHKIFAKKEDAEKYLSDVGPGPHGIDHEDCEYGYYLSSYSTEYDVC